MFSSMFSPLLYCPFKMNCRHYQAGEGVDAVEEVDYGTEWPKHEHPDVARYRKFYQVMIDSRNE